MSETIEYLKRMLRYDRWGNREALASALSATNPSEKAIRLVGHIVATEHLWLQRLSVVGRVMPVWPGWSLLQSEAEIQELEKIWSGYLERLDRAELDREIRYTNSKGVPWSSRVEDVLSHVVLHSHYHRGQLASELRATGNEPVLTDFIHSTRNSLI